MKQGQVFLEFLLEYGWMFLIVIACIGALAYYGAFPPQFPPPKECICPDGNEQQSVKLTSDRIIITQCTAAESSNDSCILVYNRIDIDRKQASESYDLYKDGSFWANIG
jgi:hypothetical protein